MSGSNKPALVALRQKREDIIQALTEHFAGDGLDMEEYEQRVDLAHRATSLEALDELVSDLEPVTTEALAVRAARQDNDMEVARPKRRRLVAIFGGAERRGQWVVPADLRVTAIMGGVDLDFREAVLPPGITEVSIKSVMGGVDIIVPPNVAVEAEGFAIMGGFEEMHRAPPTPDPERPLLRISGFAVMGGMSIETRLPGESRRDARRRQRQEQRQMRDRARHRLGDGSGKQRGKKKDY